MQDPEFLPELLELRSLIRRGGAGLRSEVLCEVRNGRETWPLLCVEMGAARPELPALAFIGGIHGIERIGSQVVLAYLHSLVERLHWDASLAQLLEQVRLIFLPVVNPAGMRNQTRSNAAGVDLMRNAPVEAEGRVPWLLGGQRFSRHLPWYRGRAGEPMQPEAEALCRMVRERLHPHVFSVVLDCHSGFGVRDRIWFPYARTRQPVDCLPEIYALRSLFRVTHPHHSIYVIEPQARQYTTHGDLWDYLYDESKARARGVFLPFTLEMGSWLWVKKNPSQLFRLPGIFNPVLPHRKQRILRQHLTFLDFLVRATVSHARWRPPPEERERLFESAFAYWYKPPRSAAAGTD
jgi:hypothetical protein